jgi:phosphoribosylaminoimidazole-succinocarboxamide synthase
MIKTVLSSDYKFPGQKNIYKGKVRDVYNINDNFLLMIVSDRISAFDVVLPRGIPYKGQVLNQIAAKFLDATSDIVPNWKIASPDPNVTFGHKCEPYPVEMIVRAYLTGSSWRTYKSGARTICGIPIPDNMREHQRFDFPLITPTTKAEQGRHDEDISAEEIIRSGLIPEEEYRLLEGYSMEVFKRGSEIASQHGLILVDTKYEFGKKDGRIYLIDEINTPDSSRYFYSDGYQERFDKGLPQKQLSKEFVREWLMANNFQGREGEKVPEMTDKFVNEVSERYIELYENITGDRFVKADISDVVTRIETNCRNFLKTL